MSRRKQNSTINHGRRLRGQSGTTKPLFKYINDSYGPKNLGYFYVTSVPEEAGFNKYHEELETVSFIGGAAKKGDFGINNERYDVLEWSENTIKKAVEWSEKNQQPILLKSSKPIEIPESGKYEVIDDFSFLDVVQDDSGLFEGKTLIFNLTFIPIIIPIINQKTGEVTYEKDARTTLTNNFKIPRERLDKYIQSKYYIENDNKLVLYPYFPFSQSCVIITQTYGSQDLINVFYPKLKIYSINPPDYHKFNLATINCAEFNDSRWWDSGLVNRPTITILPRLKPEPYKPGRKATIGEEKDFDNLKNTCINFKEDWPGVLSSHVLTRGISSPKYKQFLGDMFKKVSFKGYNKIVCVVTDKSIIQNLASFFDQIHIPKIEVKYYLDQQQEREEDLNTKTLFIAFSLFSPISSKLGATLTMLLRHLYITHKSIKDPKFRLMTGMEVGPKDDKDWIRRYRNYILKMDCELALNQILFHLHQIPYSDLLFLGNEPECDYIRARLGSKHLKAETYQDLTSLNSEIKVVDYRELRRKGARAE